MAAEKNAFRLLQFVHNAFRLLQMVHLYSAFIQGALQGALHSHIHTAEAICKLPTSTSGAIWGSVYCPRTLRHVQPQFQ